MRPVIAILAFLTLSPSTAIAPAPLTDRQVYKIGLDALVDIIVVSKDEMCMGSGAVVGHDKRGRQIVITAAHLFRTPAVGIAVGVSEDEPAGTSPKATDASILAINFEDDLALLALEGSLPRTALKVGSYLGQGDPLFFFGNPDEAATTFGKGVLTRRNYPAKSGGHGTAQYFGFAWPGSSGGPILDEFGGLSCLVSMVNNVENPTVPDERVLVEQIGYCVQQPAIKRILDKAGVK